MALKKLKPTGTTNYMLSEFNIKTKDRVLFKEGGVPLHKCIYNIYEFIYNFINIGSENKIYYVHAISKVDGASRPQCFILLKMNGKKTKKERKNIWIQEEENFILKIDEIFQTFIKNGRIGCAYRNDVKPVLLLNSYHDWNECKEKLIHLKE